MIWTGIGLYFLCALIVTIIGIKIGLVDESEGPPAGMVFFLWWLFLFVGLIMGGYMMLEKGLHWTASQIPKMTWKNRKSS